MVCTRRRRSLHPAKGARRRQLSDRVNILGVGATPQDLNTAVATLERWRAERRSEYVCVVSVRGLVAAQRDPTIRHALNQCGMATEDGMPLVWWSRLAGFSQARRVCGSDLLDAACAKRSAAWVPPLLLWGQLQR